MLSSGHPHGLSTWLVGHDRGAPRGRRTRRGGRTARAVRGDRCPCAGGSHLVGVARVRGLLAAARGDTGRTDGARGGLATDAARTFPFERARALLALGAVQRRAQQRRAARETLTLALAAFEELGAAPWVTRARDELRRVSGRRQAGDDLTEAERRVAALAADGTCATRRSPHGWSSRSGRSRRTSPGPTASSACDPATSWRPIAATRSSRPRCRGFADVPGGAPIASAHPIRRRRHDRHPGFADDAAADRACRSACGGQR